MGFEPTTFSLARRRTTTVLRPRFDAYMWGVTVFFSLYMLDVEPHFDVGSPVRRRTSFSFFQRASSDQDYTRFLLLVNEKAQGIPRAFSISRP